MPERTINWLEFSKAYLPTMMFWFFSAGLLALPKYSYANGLLQTTALLLWSYAGHVIAHKLASANILDTINPHVFLHHKKSIDLPRWLELLIETIVNFFSFFIIIILQKIFNLKIFSTSLVLGAAFLYITVHILDFSIFGNEDHKLHHEKELCNYDPEFLDTLFNTRCNPEKPYTNKLGEIPHAVLGFSLAYLVKRCLKLD